MMSDKEFREMLDALIKSGKIKVISPIGRTESGVPIYPGDWSDWPWDDEDK